ncbi:MAG: C25 family cysteine peptidase, partial [candidate division WOR-3 bacterium]
MRKIFKNIKLIFFLSFWCFYLHSEYFPLNGNLTPESLKINILSSNLSELILEVEIPGIFIKDTFVNNEVYQLIRVLKEDGYTDEVGKPLLPLINRTIAIPPQSGIYTEFEVIKDTFLNNLLIFPSQIGIVGDSIFPFIKDEIYTKNVFYPQERIRVGNPGILKDFRIVNISISPFSYNPVNKELIIYKKFRVNIQFSGIDTRNSLPSLPSKVNYEDVPFYKSLILNYEAFSPLQTVEPPGYLIITADEYYFTLSDFVLWKKKLGYNVILTKLSEITNPQNPDTHDIKEYIKYVYNTLGNLSYVLLIGDGAKNNPELPIFKYPDIYGNPDVYSDYYYCLLSGNDNFPDVYLGRFNVSNINQLSIMINKHFIYERYTPLNWNAKKVFLVAGIEGKPQMDSLYTKKKINICKDYLRPHNIPYTTAYGVDPTFDIINKIKTEINSGVGLVNYRGHGSEDKWAKLQYINSSGFCEFTTNDVKSFSNYNFLSIVLNVTCLNGSIQEPLECMVEAWTLYQGGGSVAALGATRETNTEVNKAFDRKIFETI